MKAVKVENIFGTDWKTWREDYNGHTYQFVYNGVEYLPLDIVKKVGYEILDCDIEVLNIE